MENNQEHKLDNFFKKSLENQSFPPPENLWESIAAETIGKESKGINPLARYAVSSLVLLMIMGLGYLLLKDNTTDEIVSKKMSSEVMSSDLVTDVVSRQPSNVNELKNHQTVGQTTSNILDITENSNISKVNTKRKSNISSQASIDKQATQNSKPIVENVIITDEGNHGAVLLTENKILEVNLSKILSKHTVFNDLSNKNQQLLKEKIRPLEVFEEDLPEESPRKTGSKLSLKHPIVSFDYGVSSNTWKFKSENSLVYNVIYPEKSSSTFLKANVAWNLTAKSRLGISAAYHIYNLGKPYYNIPIWSSYWAAPSVYLNTKNGEQYYSAILPLGTVNIPAERFAEVVKLTPDTIHSVRSMLMTQDHRMTTFTLGITSQNDILNLQSKKNKHLNLKIYGIADFTFQRQISYRYIAKDVISSIFWTGGTINNNEKEISYDSKHLENGSNFIFGVRVGLGLGWQFTPKLGLHLEGTTQNSFNSWVKNQEVNTYLRNNGINVGINLSL